VELLHKLYTRRMRVRLVGVRLSELSHAGSQMDLFADYAREDALYRVLDRMKDRYGRHSLRWAGGMG